MAKVIHHHHHQEEERIDAVGKSFLSQNNLGALSRLGLWPPTSAVGGTTALGVVAFSILLPLLWIFRPRRASKANEFVVAVYPVGVQLWSNGQQGCPVLIPRQCIVDCRIQEVIHVHRVSTSARLFYEKGGTISGTQDTVVASVDLFPQVELSYTQCQEICRILRDMLGIITLRES